MHGSNDLLSEPSLYLAAIKTPPKLECKGSAHLLHEVFHHVHDIIEKYVTPAPVIRAISRVAGTIIAVKRHAAQPVK